jgi:hypothetical protein
MKAFAYFDGQHGRLAILGQDGEVREIVTTRAHPGAYIRIDDSRNYPQLCEGGSRRGATLQWSRDAKTMAYHFARDCDATPCKTRADYEARLERPRTAKGRPRLWP